MRLLFVTVGDTFRRTGGHRYNGRVISGLRGRRAEVEELSVSGESAEAQRAASNVLDDGVAPGEFDAVVVDALARLVCAPHLDRWRAHTPVVAMVHELPSVAGGGGPPPEEPLLRADRLVCVSRHGASLLEGRGVPADRIHVVPPGLEAPVSVPDGDGVPRVLCVAQWIPRKGIAELVEAHSTLRERGPRAVLDLIGETDADPGYAARVRDSAAGAEDVTIRGPVADDELRRAYAAADLFALPSTYEGYGMVYAEALSYGLPVVALRAGPVPGLVGEAGLLVEPGDSAGLADALRALLSDAALRRRLSGAALRRARGLPGWEDTVDGFLAALEAAVSGRAARR